MRIKSFRADSAREALALVRQEMGEDAVILDTRVVRAGGVLGLGARRIVEVMAAVDEYSDAARDGVDAPQPTPPAPPNSDSLAAIRDLQEEIREIKSLVQSCRVEGSLPDSSTARWMSEVGVNLDLLGLPPQELAAVADRAALVDMLAAALEPRVAPPAASDKSVIALVGPTGVGKTTTLAKLAAHSALRERRSTALITCDTFRIGAVEQIRIYSRILDVPLEVVTSPEDMADAVRKHQHKDVILIDTIGRSHRNTLQLRELQALLAPAQPTEVHLVLSAAASHAAQMEAAQNLSALSPNRLVVTKIDESGDRGCIVNLPLSTGLPVSCVTDGQNVPDDICIAEPKLLAELAVGVVA